MTPPLDPALRERLGRIHTGSLSDAMGSFGVPAPGLRPITPGARLLGPAYTVKCSPGPEPPLEGSGSAADSMEGAPKRKGERGVSRNSTHCGREA